jgi:hypothetical protein
LILKIQNIYQNYYNPKDGSVVNFDSTKCQTTTYYGHLEPVLTGISQETKQNNFVEEQVFLLEDFLFGLKSSRWFRSFFYQVVDPNFKFHRFGEQVLGYDHKFDSNYICDS